MLGASDVRRDQMFMAHDTCPFCNGTQRVESLEERDANGDWHPNTMLHHDVADAWIASDGNGVPLRWVDKDCPVCGGVGEVAIEFVRGVTII